jgi:hypothetical protein
MTESLSRRAVFLQIAEISLAGVVGAIAASTTLAATHICADPNSLDAGQQNLRSSLSYTEVSADQTKTCSECALFQPAGEGCGTCMIFNGPANPKGHCDSWSAKS